MVPWVALRTALWILCFHSDSGGGEGLARGEGGGEAGGGECLPKGFSPSFSGFHTTLVWRWRGNQEATWGVLAALNSLAHLRLTNMHASSQRFVCLA